MKRLLVFLFILAIGTGASAQRGPQVRRIYFNLYTDSIKTVLNYYVNVEAELSGGRFQPMDTSMIEIHADQGRMSGNEWIAPRNIGFDKVHFTTSLRSDPAIRDEITVYIKRAIDPRDDPAAGDIEMPVVPKELQRRRR
jgi:hypothetical protein